ncbi:hypothetical protein E2C01_049767 [Portunus trituberculatus]|uniref:Uncharacterized protein n=1 Tax=Portunus trituberculatus TaxID=210409 RepID=A0A5B7G794_PORTR|nr:hypothetical protein [Portunus trituberculatus]
MDDGDRRARGHSNMIKGQCLRNIKKFSFPHRTVDIWNGLSEDTSSKNCAQIKGKVG